MRILVINGPNLNMLGVREPEIYGNNSYEYLCSLIRDYAAEKDVEAEIFQSNHEGEIVDAIQKAYFDGVDGIVINPAAYTHTSIAILDALKAVATPAVEVHISDISAREDFRKTSYTALACEKSFIGLGFDGYLRAVDYLISKQKR